MTNIPRPTGLGQDRQNGHSMMKPKPASVASYSDANLPPQRLRSYYDKRTKLFKRFDQGIWLNDEGWYSVTPEDLADAITSRIVSQLQRDEESDPALRPGIHLMDAFCGPGGNVISFAKHPDVSRVTAVDISSDMLHIAEHNASVYELDMKRLRFIQGDVLDIYNVLSRSGLDDPHSRTKISAIFMSPPWGGTSYHSNGKGSLQTHAPETFRLDLMPVPLDKVIEVTRKITPNLAIMLPPTTSLEQIHRYLPDIEFELVPYLVDGVLKMVVVYTGVLGQPVRSSGADEKNGKV